LPFTAGADDSNRDIEPGLLLDAAKPSARVPTSMHYCDHYDFSFFDTKVNDEEWRDGFLMYSRMYQGLLRESFSNFDEFIKKFLAKFSLLFCRPSSGRVMILFSFGTKPNHVIHNDLRISAMTSSAARPRFPSSS
jgi:hypothetical protein